MAVRELRGQSVSCHVFGSPYRHYLAPDDRRCACKPIGRRPRPTRTVFDLTDNNKDNRIDRGEFHQRMIEVFSFEDENKDGMLIELDGVSPADFKGADRDGDGKLSLYEFLNARLKDFDAADADQDGTLTVEEISHLGP